MLKERAEAYLASQGLAPEDVPKVMGAFVTGKYCIWAGFVAGCSRYRPLARLFRRTYVPFADRVRARVSRELARTQGQETRYAQRLRSIDDRRAHFRSWRHDVRAGLGSRLRQRLDRGRGEGALERVGYWYRTYSEKYAEAAARSRIWSFVARALAQDPRSFAMALAEGSILFKFTFPVHGTLLFFFTLRCYQRREPGDWVTLHELIELNNRIMSYDGEDVE
mmetsp:Transcript_22785/g.63760  ORF Transcript_22785/g.63760 Transcript_22785/m.63760 type:complete len:222 (-) Transcript_22785:193-858(-)